MKKELYEWLIAIGIALVLMLIIHQFFFMNYAVKGDSMAPTLKDGEKVIVSRINYTLGHINNGDVIVFHADSKHDYVKRVIGKGGDTVVYKDDTLYVNDKKVKESYLDENKLAKTNHLLTENLSSKEMNDGDAVIPARKLLVLGDNREVSKDSRYFGLVDESEVVGEVALRFWPFNAFHYDFDPATK